MVIIVIPHRPNTVNSSSVKIVCTHSQFSAVRVRNNVARCSPDSDIEDDYR